MLTRYFALIFGIAYVGAGLLGFIPGAAPHGDMPPLAVDAGSGYLLGLFPVNVLHNIVHLALGAWGIASYASYTAARTYGRGLAIIYALFAVMGLIPGLNTTFGLVPLFGGDVWLHVVSAAIAAYFGFVAPDDTRRTTTSGRAAFPLPRFCHGRGDRTHPAARRHSYRAFVSCVFASRT